jgi:pimeloyl-ACP methyl ester carboxylesterase
MTTRLDFSIEHDSLFLSGSRFGNGSRHLLAFHGFGQDSWAMRPLENALVDTTVWSFNLPFHGESTYRNQPEPISNDLWKAAMQKFLKQNGIECFSLAGYSMGGKFALSTLASFPDKVENMYLMAPDGIKTSFWYSMSTYPQWARNYFQRLIEQPEPFFKLAGTLNRYKLMDSGILKFAEWHMHTPEKRRKVYNSWTSSSELKFSMRRIAKLLLDNDIKLHLYLGEHDKLMTAKGMSRLLKHLPKPAYCLHILPTGHTGLIRAAAQSLRQHEGTDSIG